MEISKEEAQEMFSSFDTSKTGQISTTDLRELLSTIGFPVEENPAILEAALKVLDKDNSGTIDFDEFYRWISPKEDA